MSLWSARIPVPVLIRMDEPFGTLERKGTQMCLCLHVGSYTLRNTLLLVVGLLKTAATGLRKTVLERMYRG